MFRKKTEKFRLELTHAEARLLMTAMLHFRNRAVREGIPADDINELIIRLTRKKKLSG